MNEKTQAKCCGVRQLIKILAHGRMKSEARDFIQNVLKSPNERSYMQGTDVSGEIAGVRECLEYVAKTWPTVGTADGLIHDLEALIESPVDDDSDVDTNDSSKKKSKDSEGKEVVADKTEKVEGVDLSPTLRGSKQEDPGKPDHFPTSKTVKETKKVTRKN